MLNLLINNRKTCQKELQMLMQCFLKVKSATKNIAALAKQKPMSYTQHSEERNLSAEKQAIWFFKIKSVEDKINAISNFPTAISIAVNVISNPRCSRSATKNETLVQSLSPKRGTDAMALCSSVLGGDR